MDGGMLSQDEINALLSGMAENGGEPPKAESPAVEENLTAAERDAIGEIANISMGTSATTLYSLVNCKVDITAPTVTETNWEGLIGDYDAPCVFIQIKYTVGLEGSNIIILKEKDVKVITDLMMGGDGTNTDGELSELHLSAISEAMNQMMGSSATSLSTMLGRKIDISPPYASLIDINELKDESNVPNFLTGTFVKIAFKMTIGELVNSEVIQLYPIDLARELYNYFIGTQTPEQAAPAPAPVPATAAAPTQMGTPPQMNMQPNMYMNQGMMPQVGMTPQMGMTQMGMPQMGMPQMGAMPMMQGVNVQPAQFQTFSAESVSAGGGENMGLIMDVPLEVTVELGRTKKAISDILNFSPGTIIELDKIAGEPIDVLVNGKLVARGEVVVIEESFGVRVTEIIK